MAHYFHKCALNKQKKSIFVENLAAAEVVLFKGCTISYKKMIVRFVCQDAILFYYSITISQIK